MDLVDKSSLHGWSDCAYRKQRPLPPLAQTPLPAKVLSPAVSHPNTKLQADQGCVVSGHHTAHNVTHQAHQAASCWANEGRSGDRTYTHVSIQLIRDGMKLDAWKAVARLLQEVQGVDNIRPMHRLGSLCLPCQSTYIVSRA